MTGSSRREVVASLAALPAIAAATIAAAHDGAVVNDPIFPSIERYRRALDAFESADELSEPSHFEAAVTNLRCQRGAICDSAHDRRRVSRADGLDARRR